MNTVLRASEMKRCDFNTIEFYGISSAVLMERASLSVVSVLTQYISMDSKILVFVGMGNNGGDGVCVARILHNMGYDASLLLCGDENKFSDDLKEQLDVADKYNIEKVTMDSIDNYNVFVDGIFGIGLSRDVKGSFSDYINAFNNAKGFKIAIDIPSGINTDNGNVMNVACKVDVTVTFNYCKPGHLLYPGREYSGEVYVRDIGINDNSFLDDINPEFFCYTKEDIALLNNRGNDTNKGDFGKVIVIAGSNDMSGAAFLAAKAGLRMGAGLVKIYTVKNNATILGSELPEALISTYETYDEKQLSKELQWSSVCVIGPGIGQDKVAGDITRYVLDNYDKPLVIDADAINIIIKDLTLLNNSKDNRIITPHVGEMSRLCGLDISYIKNNMIEVARDYSKKLGLTVVLKSASSVTSCLDGKLYINTSGNNGMSTAGSGDVLAGIIAGIIANNISVDIAAGLGAYIHGLCGDKASDITCEHFVIASDIIDMISEVIRG